MSMRGGLPAVSGLLLFSACGDGAPILPRDAGGETPAATAMVGPAGGGLQIPGMMALGIPAGALTTMTEISVYMEDTPPAGAESSPPVQAFETQMHNEHAGGEHPPEDAAAPNPLDPGSGRKQFHQPWKAEHKAKDDPK